MRQHVGEVCTEGREGEKPKEQPIVEGNVLLLAWAGRPPAEPCWPVIQTATPQEPWHSVSLPTKQTHSETASIFLKSQLDLPPGGEAVRPGASHIRVINFLPAVRGG